MKLKKAGEKAFMALDGRIEAVGSSGHLSGDFAALRDYLTDNHNMGVCHVFFDEDAALTFPSYLYEFDEDTFARAIHHRIEGCGYAYRECVGRRSIAVREYDGLFRLAAQQDFTAAVNIAFGRLLYPADLAPGHRERYERFLEQAGAGMISVMITDSFVHGVYESVKYLLDHLLLRREVLEEALSLFSEAHTEEVALLLAYQKQHWGARRAAVLSLDL